MPSPSINIPNNPFLSNIGNLGNLNTTNSYNLPSTGDPDADAAALTRAEFLRFKQQGLPAIEGLISDAEKYLDPSYKGPEFEAARQSSKESSAILRGVQERNISRYGGVDRVRQQQFNRDFDRQSTLAQVGAVSYTRDALRERGLSNLSAVSNLVNKQYTGAVDAVTSAGLNQAQRNTQYKMAKKQHKANMISSGIGLAGTAIMLAFMV